MLNSQYTKYAASPRPQRAALINTVTVTSEDFMFKKIYFNKNQAITGKIQIQVSMEILT